jgi:hypothetical protein
MDLDEILYSQRDRTLWSIGVVPLLTVPIPYPTQLGGFVVLRSHKARSRLEDNYRKPKDVGLDLWVFTQSKHDPVGF